MSSQLRRNYKPDVPEVIASQVSPNSVEKYLLDQTSVMRQQNEALIEAAEAIEVQTTKTNGRVSQHDRDLAIISARVKHTEDYVKIEKRTRRWIVGIIAGGASTLGPALYFLVEHIFGDLFDRWLHHHL